MTTDSGLHQGALGAFLAVAPDMSTCSAEAVSERLDVRFELVKQGRGAKVFRAEGSGVIADYELKVPKTGSGLATILIANVISGTVRYQALSDKLGGSIDGSFDVQPAGGPVAYYETFRPGRNEIHVGAGLDKPLSAVDVIVECR
ncbi:hypothetical protein RXV86_16325 [Alisedimentitalea sp. MJ-SS2]|uniref:hypothetical protein n=1 Tax=Aliisedimentitalea sp. MJ-SS2 TaxID=3049795 RepID=UPI0029113BA6|nr:hypothetical protein [Alisedimentitalea sp. MJ-SS2]MDU8928961.1 hypothetical protein [Alisedimentitalea sp. MJ-SS2]